VSLRYSLLAAAVIVWSAAAQEPPTATVKGTLHDGDKPIIRGYLIELNSMATHQSLERIEVAADGEFRAPRIPHGEYVLRVTNYHGETVAQQYITVNGSPVPFDIRLPEVPASPTGGTVSVRQLLSPPNKKAMNASVTAQHFSESGRFGEAAAEYEKAVRISPDYAVAHSNLGVQYLRLGRFADAATEIRRSLEIAGPNAHDLINLGYALYQLGEFAESAASVEAALKLQQDVPNARQILQAARQQLNRR
jgi:tetratricopeptide (TPR) repeat protein